MTFAGGREQMGRLLDDPAFDCTAVVVANVASAAGALAAAARRGVVVPRDLSVVCIHDLDVCEMTSPSLTAVRLPLPELARRAVQILDDTAASRDAVVEVAPTLLPRQSTSFLR
jgi:LacI family transcriptional regulator